MTSEEADKLADRIAFRLRNSADNSETTTCLICGKVPEFRCNGYVMGYESRYDFGYVCEPCIVDLLDPAIDKARANA